ncbi:signal peptidase II [Paenibacillus rigui]|uniref:Lipoprotein signal peptidase n=1 Tax=Paenibacillus rigui TaxID=554312 RepID=A0A229UY65_9BACL|nr:signal peptidase II [Paenibacillus rigui]OXM87889.1 signal peptidase II [Paenibacillus rigui]
MLFYIIAGLVVAIDQMTKILIRMNVEIGETIPLWGMELTHYENSGMAHSLFQGYGRLFAVAAILFVTVVIYYRRQGVLKGVMADLSFGFLAGGAAGNGIDRILFGQVTDFLTSRSGKGILNLADHAIEIGIVLFIVSGLLQMVRKRRSSELTNKNS